MVVRKNTPGGTTISLYFKASVGEILCCRITIPEKRRASRMTAVCEVNCQPGPGATMIHKQGTNQIWQFFKFAPCCWMLRCWHYLLQFPAKFRKDPLVIYATAKVVAVVSVPAANKTSPSSWRRCRFLSSGGTSGAVRAWKMVILWGAVETFFC